MSRDAELIDSANCQFFINVSDNPTLDHQSREDATSFGYCVFGEVVEGMDVVDRISQMPRSIARIFLQLPKNRWLFGRFPESTRPFASATLLAFAVFGLN
jgi:peptidyl-prolyl cis-trans isomerase A (cyclophilin A)